jgi:hypothetical protein
MRRARRESTASTWIHSSTPVVSRSGLPARITSPRSVRYPLRATSRSLASTSNPPCSGTHRSSRTWRWSCRWRPNRVRGHRAPHSLQPRKPSRQSLLDRADATACPQEDTPEYVAHPTQRTLGRVRPETVFAPRGDGASGKGAGWIAHSHGLPSSLKLASPSYIMPSTQAMPAQCRRGRCGWPWRH